MINPKEFEWDKGNANKNFKKHNVTDQECEEVFFCPKLLVYHDEKHSAEEERFYALGETIGGRKLFVVFTIRNEKIRVILARDMNRKERRIYEKEERKSS